MQQNFPFCPCDQATVNAVMDGSDKTLAIAAGDAGRSVRLVNSGTAVIFWRYTSAATTGASVPLLPNSVEVFDLPGGVTAIHAIGAAGSTLYATPGFGS